MSIPEILFRVKQIIRRKFSKFFSVSGLLNSVPFSSRPPLFEINNLDFSYPTTDSVNIFNKNFLFTHVSEIDWHKDISTGKRFPIIPAAKINIICNSGPSAKHVWEINRLQFLTGICLNYRKTVDDRYLQLFFDINHSWNLQNPYLQGINWYSNIEVNLRLITWFFCWELLEADKLYTTNNSFKYFVTNEWNRMIYQHCLYSYNNPSKYSSANNHLISEYAGLFVASSKWNFYESDKWRDYARTGLENEILRQHSSNGINREEAAEYIQFITDFFVLAYIVGEKTGNRFSDRYRETLFKIFRYIYDILDIKGNYPKYGDEDDGKCFILDFEKGFDNFSSLMTSAAIIFKDPLFKSKSHGLDNKNKILFGEEGALVFNSIPELTFEEKSRFYTEEGHFILRKKASGHEIFLHFDAAPLGYLSIAAHGHADAMAFIMHIDGWPFFVDSGTYTYHTETEWRNYFIGTIAHNTVRINTKNQAINAGPTLWLKHYRSRVLNVESEEGHDRIVASHDGYLKEKAEHIREIFFDKTRDEVLLKDTIKVLGKRSIMVEIPFHLAPDIRINYEDDHFNLWYPDLSVIVKFYPDKNLRHKILNGQSEPFIIGWYSKAFMQKEPTNTIYFSSIVKSTVHFEFRIKIN